VGSVIGGFAAIRWGAPPDASRRFTVLLGALALAHAPLALAHAPLALAPLLLVSGVTIAPVLTTAMTLVGAAAPAGTTTEAFTWTSTGITAGIAVGAALGGALAEAASPGAAFALAAVACALGAGLGAARRPAFAAAASVVS
jgi:predicted MFS family arabinose efflux permease